MSVSKTLAEALNPGILRHQITWQRKTVPPVPPAGDATFGDIEFGEEVFGGMSQPSAQLSEFPVTSYGTDVFIWVPVLVCRARVLCMGGTEIENDQQKMGMDTFQIHQHYYKGLRVQDRIEWWNDGEVKYFDVLDISDPQGFGRWQVVTAKFLEGREAE